MLDCLRNKSNKMYRFDSVVVQSHSAYDVRQTSSRKVVTINYTKFADVKVPIHSIYRKFPIKVQKKTPCLWRGVKTCITDAAL